MSAELKDEVKAIKIEPQEQNILNEVMTSLPLWNSLELKLESIALQNRAKEIKSKLFDVLSNDEPLIELITKMKDYDDFLIIRAVNVSCLSILIGLTLELMEGSLIDLAISALLCNIGFINMDKNNYYAFLNNKEKLDLVDKHITESLAIITKYPKYCRNKDIIYGIVDHHEYYSGGGYPLGKKGKEISLFGRIIAVAMEYDTLVSYMEGYNTPASKVTSIMCENKDKKLDEDILRICIYRSNLYKVGETFYNTAGDRGEIIGFSNYIEAPHKPIVRCSNGTIIDYYNSEFKSNL